MLFPFLPTRKAYNIANGVFLILLGYLFYTGQWWPGILFALGLTVALRQYLTGQRFNFLITILLIGFLGVITFTGQAFSSLFPILLIGIGIYLIIRENLPYHKGSPPNNRHLD